MGVWIAAAVLLGLAILPLGIRIRYNASGLVLKVIAGPVKISVLPFKKIQKKQKQKQKSSQKGQAEKTAVSAQKQPSPPEKPPAQHRETGGSLTRFLPLVKIGFQFLGDFRRKLRLDNLYLRLILAGDDPCDLAVNYGRIWAAVGNLMPQLERLFVIKKRDIQVECDFTVQEMSVVAHIDITITLGRLLTLAVIYGIRVLLEFLSLKRKGGGEK